MKTLPNNFFTVALMLIGVMVILWMISCSSLILAFGLFCLLMSLCMPVYGMNLWIVPPPSTDILSIVQGLMNENPDYFSQVKGILLNISEALTNLGETAAASALTLYANGQPQENILKWVDLKPVLLGVQAALDDAGADVTALNLLLQPIPTGDGEVYSDQLKPILTEIADILAGLGQ